MLRIVIALALVVGGTVVLTTGGAPIAAEVANADADADAGADLAPELIAIAPSPPAYILPPAVARATASTLRVPTDPLHARVFRPPRA